MCACIISTSISYWRASQQMRLSCVCFGSVRAGTN